jgi:Phage-related protein, tail component
VVRTSGDNNSSYVQNKTVFESYTEIIDAKLRYPNSALMAVRVDSQQFQSVPSRYYDIKGLKIRVPSNYDPDTREYTGEWDGTFQVAWSKQSGVGFL